jgi:cell division protein FtsZ
MSEQGTAMMGTGIASGPSRALEAASAAVGSPLLEDINLENARGVLVNITGGEKVSIGEIEKVLEQIDQFAADDAMIIHGVAIDNSMEPGDLKVTIVATGLGSGKKKSNFGIDSMGNKNSSSVPSINTVKPINDLQDIEREASLDYLDVPSFVKRQID